MEIIPSILVSSKEEFIKQITAVQKSVSLAQLDIADGRFVPNVTWADPNVVEKTAKIDIELHLMTKFPMREAERWSATEQIKRVLFHYETAENLKHTLAYLKQFGWEVGIVLNPDTPIDVLTDHLSEINSVMFMGVYPGFQGQKLIPDVLEKIKTFSSLYPHIFTEIDGAVNEENLPKIIESGVKAICPGSAIFKNKRTAKENIERMRRIVELCQNT